MCGGDSICRASALRLYFEVLVYWDFSGLGVGVLPPANGNAQVRLKVDKNLMTGHHSDRRKCGCSREEKEK